MAADTGDCTIFFYGSKEKLNELTFFMKEAWRVHCNSESYEVNRIDEYSWLGDYDEEWNVIHSLGQVNSLGYQLIPGFLKKVKEKFPELSIKGIVNHNWLICEGEEHMKITSESNSTEVNCEEWCLKELDLQDWESEEEQERAQAELEESWACNKVGEYYRLGLYPEKNLSKAFNYYNISLDVPLELLNPWAPFNLAKYFYLEGNLELGLEPNENKAIEYFKLSAQKGIPNAYEELIYIYLKKPETNISLIKDCLTKLSKTSYYDKIKDKLTEKLSKAKIIIVEKSILN